MLQLLLPAGPTLSMSTCSILLPLSVSAIQNQNLCSSFRHTDMISRRDVLAFSGAMPLTAISLHGLSDLSEELDSEYLIIWDGFEGKPWAYRNSDGRMPELFWDHMCHHLRNVWGRESCSMLRTTDGRERHDETMQLCSFSTLGLVAFLLERVQDGYSFPMNPAFRLHFFSVFLCASHVLTAFPKLCVKPLAIAERRGVASP